MLKQIGKECQQSFYQSINKTVEIKTSVNGFNRLDTLNVTRHLEYRSNTLLEDRSGKENDSECRSERQR